MLAEFSNRQSTARRAAELRTRADATEARITLLDTRSIKARHFSQSVTTCTVSTVSFLSLVPPGRIKVSSQSSRTAPHLLPHLRNSMDMLRG